VYVIPEKHSWTLVVNKNVTAGSKYDEKQDLVRAPMQLGETDNPVKPPEVAFGLGRTEAVQHAGVLRENRGVGGIPGKMKREPASSPISIVSLSTQRIAAMSVFHGRGLA